MIRLDLIIPKDYDPKLSIRETQEAIRYIRETFQDEFGKEMGLNRVSAPMYVEKSSGINDNLNGYEKPVSFTLAKGIHNGSSLQDVINAYGEPKDSYRADSLGYWTYTYQDEYSKYFKLTIYDDKGVTAFSYDMY